MITFGIESDNIHVKHIHGIQVNCVTQVPLRAIWLWHQQKQVLSYVDSTYTDDSSGSNAKERLTMVACIVQRLNQRLMPPLNNQHTSSLTYPPCCKRLNQGNMPFNAQFSILDEQQTLQRYGNTSSSRLKVAIWTHPHSGKHCILSSWLMISPPCGPSGTNHMNCLLVAFKWRHRNCYCIISNVVCIVETTESVIMIDVVCEVGKPLETPSTVIL